jgi:hypothetical protein
LILRRLVKMYLNLVRGLRIIITFFELFMSTLQTTIDQPEMHLISDN